MLVIIGDMHLTDGTLGESVSPESLQVFVRRLGALTAAASHRSGGGFKPIEKIDLLLLGDVLDLLRSARWLATEARPWRNPQSSSVAAVVEEIVHGALTNNAQSAALLWSLAANGISIPSSDRAGGGTHRVPVRIHYLLGNHDWPLRLPGRAYDRLRQKIVQEFGLANRGDFPFPHDPAECDAILETLRIHKVLARHGDIFDPLCFAGDRNTSSLSDVINIELLNKFAEQIEFDLAADLPEQLLNELRTVGNVRPLLSVPGWIDNLLQRTSRSAQAVRIKRAWNEAVDQFLALDVLRTADIGSPVDLVDVLRQVLKLDQKRSLRRADAIVQWLHGLTDSDDSSYRRQALAEEEFRCQRARYVVYGHTHRAEAVALQTGELPSSTMSAAHFNPGAWATTNTGVAFFHGDENRGKPYEIISAAAGDELLRTAA